MHTIVVPLDGSAAAESILPTALNVAKRLNSRLVLLSVFDSPAIPLPPAMLWGGEVAGESIADDPVHTEKDRLVKSLESSARLLNDADPAVEVRTVLLEGAVGESISRYAQEEDARLIIISTHGYGGVSRVWLGSVSDYVVRHSTASVLLVRPTPMPDFDSNSGSFKRVLIPVDGSSFSEQIINVATQLAGRDDVGYTLFRVVPPLNAIQGLRDSDVSFTEKSADIRREADRQLTKLEQAVWANGFDADSHIRESAQPAQAILRFAFESDTDLIAMSTHGRGSIGKIILGSVADKVLRGSTVPVLLRRLPDDALSLNDDSFLQP